MCRGVCERGKKMASEVHINNRHVERWRDKKEVKLPFPLRDRGGKH